MFHVDSLKRYSTPRKNPFWVKFDVDLSVEKANVAIMRF
jgi:hypothetical protein